MRALAACLAVLTVLYITAARAQHTSTSVDATLPALSVTATEALEFTVTDPEPVLVDGIHPDWLKNFTARVQQSAKIDPYANHRRIYGDVLPRPQVYVPPTNRTFPATVRKSVETLVRFFMRHRGYHVAASEEQFIEVAKHHAKREIYALNFNDPLPAFEFPDLDLTPYISIPDFTFVTDILDFVTACYDDPANLGPYCGQGGVKCCFGKFPPVWTFPRFDIGFYDAVYMVTGVTVPLTCPYYRDGKQLFVLPLDDPLFTIGGYPFGILRNWFWAAGQTMWHAILFVTDAIVLPIFPDATYFELPNGGSITDEMACFVLYSGAFVMVWTLIGIFLLHLVLFSPTCLFCSCWCFMWPRNCLYLGMSVVQMFKPPSIKQLAKKAAKRAVGIPPALGAMVRPTAVKLGWVDHKHAQ